MQALLNAGLSRLSGYVCVFVGGALHLVHSWLFGAIESRHQHLREAEFFRPGDPVLLIRPEFFDTEVRAYASNTLIVQNFAKCGAFVFGKAGEARIGITDRRTQLDGLKSGGSELLDGAGKILGDHVPDRPSLASDGHAERIGGKTRRSSGRQKKGRPGGRLPRLSKRLFFYLRQRR